MTNWKDTIVSPEATLHDAIAQLDAAALQIVMVVSPEGRLQGTVTDGDVRRAILSGRSLTEPVAGVMNVSPVTVTTDAGRDDLVQLMKSSTVRRLPVLDAAGHVVGLELLEQLVDVGGRDNHVVLMVGGLGTRLMPRTEHVPKPMLHVGGKPMLERIVEGFKGHGFRRFTMAVNYRGEMIKEHFGDGSRFGVEIDYVNETKRLGTAGALSLVGREFEAPFFVMNGDVLTDCNFDMMLDFHLTEGAKITMGVREYDMQVPFGVVKVDQPRILSIDEKPVHSFFVNAGIYVLDPAVLEYIPADEFTDMPSVVQRLIDDGHMASAFPLREAWLDVGRDEDFRRAEARYGENDD